MKNKKLRESLFTLLSGVFFGTLITFGALCALATAFSLHQPPVNNSFHIPIDLRKLLWISIGSSILFSVLFTVKRLWILVPVMVFAYLGLGWYYGSLSDSLYDLLYIISKRYDNAYGWGVLLLKESRPIHGNLSVVFRHFAVIGTAVVTWATCKRQSSFWVVLLCLLCFAPCCVMTNTVPESWVLFLLILSIVLFMITNYGRKASSEKSMLLCLAYIVPLTIALILLFTFVPRSEYNGKDRADRLLAEFEEFFNSSGLTSGGLGTNRQKEYDLSSLEKRKERNTPVMYVKAPESKTYYLRGEVYSTYIGTGWVAEEEAYLLPWLPGYPTGDTITVRTRFVHDMLYVPYCAAPSILTEGDLIFKNADGLKEYSFDCFEPQNQSMYYSHPRVWTELPTSTSLWCSSYLEDQLWKQNRPLHFSNPYAAAAFIKDLVSSSAVYDLAPKKMDSSYTDFAQWFMEEGESGYCVHFASAATVLLRSLGVPARYVTGYVAEAQAGHETTVYQKNSHAWVEYWTEDRGWLILDPTPSGDVPEEPVVSTEEATEETPSFTDATEPEPSTTKTEVEQTETKDNPITGPEDNKNGESPSDGGTFFSKLWRLLGRILKWIMFIGILISILIGQQKLRVYLWNKKTASVSANDCALLYWNRSLQYSKLLKKKPDSKLKRIAEKAKFSKHDITSTELDAFRQYFDHSQEELKMQGIFRRFYGKWILAL